jgi:hypothetical protein
MPIVEIAALFQHLNVMGQRLPGCFVIIDQMDFAAYLAVRRETHGIPAFGTTRKRLAARIDSANWGEADSDAAAR